MPKYRISQKRIVTERGSVIVEVPEGVVPLQWLHDKRVEGEDPFDNWEVTDVSYLSGEVEPIPEPEEEDPLETHE